MVFPFMPCRWSLSSGIRLLPIPMMPARLSCIAGIYKKFPLTCQKINSKLNKWSESKNNLYIWKGQLNHLSVSDCHNNALEVNKMVQGAKTCSYVLECEFSNKKEFSCPQNISPKKAFCTKFLFVKPQASAVVSSLTKLPHGGFASATKKCSLTIGIYLVGTRDDIQLEVIFAGSNSSRLHFIFIPDTALGSLIPRCNYRNLPQLSLMKGQIGTLKRNG